MMNMKTKWTADGMTGSTVIIHDEWGEVCRVADRGDTTERDKRATLISLAPEMAELVSHVARGACLAQINGDHCICYSCQAKRLLAQLEGGR